MLVGGPKKLTVLNLSLYDELHRITNNSKQIHAIIIIWAYRGVRVHLSEGVSGVVTGSVTHC